MGKLFGTDGIRGIANEHPMTSEMALRVGRACAVIFKQKGDGSKRRIIVGKDTRLSGYMIEQAISSGICSMGVNVALTGPLPTPGVAYITSSMRADAGIVISASHNEFHDNGIKIFDRFGFKLPDDFEEKIEGFIFSDDVESMKPSPEEIGKAVRVADAQGRYITYLKDTFPKELTLDGVTMVFDAANGAAYRVGPAVFEELGAKVITIGANPDGKNINRRCGALSTDAMQARVVENSAHIGVALDGDADRVVFCDEKGKIVHGDAIILACAKELAKSGRLRNNAVVATVMSNMALEIELEKAGVRFVRTQVGDRYVIDEMRRSGYSFGGEQSGHLIFLDHSTTGDGVLAALQILAVMLKNDAPMSRLAAMFEPLPQVLRNIAVKQKVDLNDIPDLANALRRIEGCLGRTGRLLVRYSGTEPKLRIMIEGPNPTRIEEFAGEIEDIARRKLGR